MYSRYIKKNNRYYALTADDLEKAFIAIRQKEGKKPALYICSDQYLTILIKHKERWTELIDLAGADFETLALINDKNSICDYCMMNGLKIPESVSYSYFKENQTYPIIIKWVEENRDRCQSDWEDKICRSNPEFDIADKTIRDGGIEEKELFVQTFIEGKNDNQFSVGGYYQEGESLVDVVVNQLKQYPQGISATVVTSSLPVCDELRRITRDFARKLHYSGFLEMEFKVDAVTREIYLLDVNPRPWGWISILGTVYSDFHRVLEGKKPESEGRPSIWKSPLRVLMGKKNKQNVELSEDIRGFSTAYDIMDIHDPKPSVMISLMAVIKIMRRIRG